MLRVVSEVDTGALERETLRIYAAARLDPAQGASPGDLARAILGPASLVVAPESMLAGGGALVRVRDQWRIYVRRGLRPEFARFTVLHELAHYILGRGATEEECDALAACLLAPRGAFERAARTLPAELPAREVYHQLARWFVATDSFAALRFGEVTSSPLVIVAPTSVRVRGATYSWPPEPVLRGLAKARTLPGLSKATLRDDPRRVALRVG